MDNRHPHTHPSRPSVAEILDGKHKFVMPSYQRGYRWDAKQVNELLEDLKSYVTDDDDKGDFYLQPLVCQYDEQSDKWIVLDGQQRLTTIWLILNYLDWDDKNTRLYSIERQISHEGKSGLRQFDLEKLNPCDDIQSYYIWEAYNIIKEWFSNLSSRKRITNNIEYALTDNENPKQVRFIWYEQDINTDKDLETREIENIQFFNRLNNGKIGLTSAELIKALFVLAFEHQESDATERAITEESLIQEWDRMELRLQDDKFAAILSRNYRDYGCRMDILFDFISGKRERDEKDHAYQLYQKLYDFETHANSPSYDLPGFWTAKGISSMREAWTDVKNVFDMLCEWYNDSRYYHYIGFLVQCGRTLQKIHSTLLEAKKDEKWTSKKKLKTLRRMVVEELKMDDKNIDDYLDSLEYGDQRIRKLLLLFNIEIYSKSDCFRFDFDAYSNENWDIEHISARNKEQLQKRDEQLAWLKHAHTILASMTGSEKATALAKELSLFIESKVDEVLSDMQKPYHDFYIKVKDLFQGGDDIEVEENGIENLTLLNSSINREYKDDPFFFKRQTIIENDKLGQRFIPSATRNVFLKYYSDSRSGASHLDVMKWSADDGADYKRAIADTLRTLLGEIK